VEELRLRLLGGLVVEGLPAKDVGSRKARTLLAALAAARGGAISAGALAELLWGDDQPARPLDQVGVLVSRLRGSLGADRIHRSDAGYALSVDWLDVAELEVRADAAGASLRGGDALSARLAATMALDLVRGDLLPEEEGSWVAGPRATAQRVIADLRLIAAEAALLGGDPVGAAAAAAAGIDQDPYDEAALRMLMRAHVALGRPASALAAYAAARHRLTEDLGVDPSAETEDLHTSVLLAEAGRELAQGEPSPPSATTAERPRGTASDGWDPLVQRARQELAAIDLDAARRDADEAVRRGGGPGALELAGWIAYYQRDFAAALRCAEDAAARTDEDERRASCLTLAGRVRHSFGDLSGAEANLREATACSVASVRGVGEVWLGSLRVHQGRPADALELVTRGATDSAAMRHPFVIPHSYIARTYAYGQQGQVHLVLGALEEWDGVLAELGTVGARYQPMADNFWAWVLGGIGRVEEATERSERALATRGQIQEPYAHALFDLAAAALIRGDAAAATAWLEQVEVPPDEHGAMAWHQRQRLWLLQARVALEAGDPTAAAELADRVVADAMRRGAPRARWQGEVVRHLAQARSGVVPDRAEVDATLRSLDELAGLEVWRATAELAQATGWPELWPDADRRAAALVATSGPEADRIEAWLHRELATMGRP
jgi:DNA-binding SARP family transcriptional activator